VWKKPLMVATPTLGVVRFEWCHARYGQIIPVNWDMTGFDISYATIGYSIDDAYNLICKKFLETRSQWLLIIEDDVLIPPDCFLKMAGYINDGKIPIVSGLYYTKANPSEPLIFRGRGNGVFSGWEFGDKVWCDGVPMGCILIHGSILKTLWDNSVRYTLPDGEKTNKVFETPRNMEFNPSTWVFKSQQGTQDLFFCDRIIKEKVIEKCGFKVKSKKNPFLVDTSLFCKHIDMGTGKQFPPFTIYKAEKNGNT
jgi:hypothetical protein